MSYELSDEVRELGVRTIAVNNQGINLKAHVAMAPWADILYAADTKWWEQNLEEALKFKGRKVTIAPRQGCSHFIHKDVFVMGNGGTHGFDPRCNFLRSGGNSGYQAVHLAAHLGARLILLFGFDMRPKDGRHHWFGYHAWREGHVGNYPLFVGRFNGLASELSKKGIEVINCTPGSALKCFPISSLENIRGRLQQMRKNEVSLTSDSSESLGSARDNLEEQEGAKSGASQW